MQQSLLNDCYISYLNLDSRTDRLAHIKEQLKKAGIENAVRTRGKLPNEFDLTLPELQVMKNRTPGAIGCHTGQAEIIKKALDLGKHAFVLEDDAQFCSDFQERMKLADEFLSKRNWQILWLGGTYHYPTAWWHGKEHEGLLKPYCNCKLERDAELTDDINFMRTYGCFSTFAYIVNKNYIKDLLEFLEANLHISIGIDFLMILLQPHINTFAPSAGMIRQIDNRSDIGFGDTIFSGFAALGQHWFVDKL